MIRVAKQTFHEGDTKVKAARLAAELEVAKDKHEAKKKAFNELKKRMKVLQNAVNAPFVPRALAPDIADIAKSGLSHYVTFANHAFSPLRYREAVEIFNLKTKRAYDAPLAERLNVVAKELTDLKKKGERGNSKMYSLSIHFAHDTEY